ncbi:MAG: transcriptional regulator, GntR family [Deltaproteobacteria bacterium]|nr:transcriptional regulator, GntR family [Deltaproteobacteria bacterium]
MQRIHHSTLSLGNQAYQELKGIILERQIPPGGKLNEGDLAKALGISRTPIREAINRLEKEGLVKIIPQRGAYVVQFTEKDIYELFLIRENLEGLAAYLAAKKMSEKDLTKLESAVEGFSEPFSEKEIKRYAREDFKFHQAIVQFSEAQRLIGLISTLHDYIRIFRLTTVGVSGRMKTSLEEHRELLRAFRERNPEEAELRMREHIRHVRDGVMENIEFFMKGEGKDLIQPKEEGK